MQGKNKLVLIDIEKLYTAFYKEPEDVRELLVDCVRKALEDYNWVEGLDIEGRFGEGGKIFCDFAIPKLHRCVSFKDYGNRYYPLSFYIKTFYGKEFDIGISIVAEEYHDDCFAIVRNGEERPAIATTWIEPVGVCIRDVIKRKCEGWELTNENIEKRAM